MSKLEKTKKDKEKQAVLPLTVIKTDVNIARLPFFALFHGELNDNFFHVVAI